jgi:soluble lytic murein transglycosylase-like protein/TolA-binding protein
MLAIFFAAAIVSSPVDSQSQAMQNLVHLAQAGNCDEAEKKLKHLSKDYAVYDLAELILARCFEGVKEWSVAHKHAHKAYEMMPQISPSFAQVPMVLGSALANRGDHYRKELQELWPFLPRIETLDTPIDLKRYYQILRVLTADFSQLQDGAANYAIAARGLYLSLLSNPQSDLNPESILHQQPATALWNDQQFIKDLANAYYVKKDYATARRYYDEYWQLTHDSSVLLRLGRIQKFLGNAAGEEQALQNLVQQAATPSETYQANIQLGRYYWNKNRNVEAKATFAQVCKANLQAQEAVHACYLWGRVLESDDLPGEAEKVLARVLQQSNVRDEFYLRKKLESILRIAWLAYRQKNYQKAWQWYETALKEDKLNLLNEETQFWMGMSALKLRQTEQAKMLFTKVAEDSPYAYYGLLARKRLMLLQATKPTVTSAATVSSEKSNNASDKTLSNLPNNSANYSNDEQRLLERYEALLKAELPDLAAKELAGINWLNHTGGTAVQSNLLDLADRFLAAHDIFSSLRIAKYGIDYDERKVTDAWLKYLYPIPYYWSELHRYAMMNGLDPYAILALIRQESEFREQIISSADAYGLMQILPTLARSLAPYLGMEIDKADDLQQISINMRLGMLHLGNLLRRYQNNWTYVLAAYNGSEGAVDRWRVRHRQNQTGTDDDLENLEFIEEITYGETKNYVKMILRNYMLYQMIYTSGVDDRQLP